MHIFKINDIYYVSILFCLLKIASRSPAQTLKACQLILRVKGVRVRNSWSVVKVEAADDIFMRDVIY